MMTDPAPLNLGRSISRVLSFRSRRAARPASAAFLGAKAPAARRTPVIAHHQDRELARHQQAFLAAALRHDARAELLERRDRATLATRHRLTATLLRAYAKPGEIERLPVVLRPGPKGTTVRPGAHPATVLFLEGAAEEFFRLYDCAGRERDGTALLDAFKAANFHRIYVARLLEIDELLRTGRADAVAEATMARRYGPHAL